MLSSQNIFDNRLDLSSYRFVSEEAFQRENQRTRVSSGDVLLTIVGTIGRSLVVTDEMPPFVLQRSVAVLGPDHSVLQSDFLARVLQSPRLQSRLQGLSQGVAQKGVYLNSLRDLQIPLPPLDVQREIVAEIEGYQKVIDGARAVVDNYRPHIPIHPDWPMVPLSQVAEVIMGQSPPGDTYNNTGEGVPLINGPVEFGPEPFSRTIVNQYTTAPTRMCRKDDLIICVRGATLGRMNISGYDGCIGRGVAAIRSTTSQRWIEFLIFAMRERIFSLGVGSTFPSITQEQLRSLPIPLPPLATQQAIVAEIEAEQALVNANRELIARMEKKIQATLARVWGEDAPAPAEA
jgi:restriction endonuclease S subunit